MWLHGVSEATRELVCGEPTLPRITVPAQFPQNSSNPA